MANYYASARSNYFKVKDHEAFKQALAPFDVQIIEDERGVVIFSNSDEGWSWWNSETDEDTYGSEVISPHLADGEVCILMEAGAEKLRYISGYAVAFTNEGREVSVSLNDIYSLAQKEWPNYSVTEATY
jgi:hypothetical protein